MRILPKLFSEFKEVKVFLVSLSLIILLFVSVIFLGIYLRSNKLLIETVRDQAASYFELILQTRRWNAGYGGVFVEKKEGIVSNPYLEQIGIKPDMTCEDNKVFTMRNPAIMTNEISKLTATKKGIRFHVTSLKPINPSNAPDAFELNALHQLERGGKEVAEIDRSVTPPLYRYMAPLFVEESCLVCHGHQGYRVGEVRGGISVNIPMDELDRRTGTNRLIIIGLSICTVLLLLSILWFMIWKLLLRLHDSREQLRHVSITDELTGLRNRRYIVGRLEEEFRRARRMDKPLGLVILDLDNFKQINDLYGHPFGDTVLKTAADRIRSSVREYDLIGRIGGEEFLVLSPDAGHEQTIKIAERINEKIKGEEMTDGEKQITVTSSIGVTMLKGEDTTSDTIFSRADRALYMAKEAGRDRVVVL